MAFSSFKIIRIRLPNISTLPYELGISALMPIHSIVGLLQMEKVTYKQFIV